MANPVVQRWRSRGRLDGDPRTAGTIVSQDEFGDCQLHLEFAAPLPPRSSDQGRGNSGVMFFGRYEIQVLDCYEYRRTPTAMRRHLWPVSTAGQCLASARAVADLRHHFHPPGSGRRTLDSPAYVTMLHNGVLVHNHTAPIGAMAYRAVGKYTPHGPKGPIVLQDHGDPVRFRNIWLRPIKATINKWRSDRVILGNPWCWRTRRYRLVRSHLIEFRRHCCSIQICWPLARFC